MPITMDEYVKTLKEARECDSLEFITYEKHEEFRKQKELDNMPAHNHTANNAIARTKKRVNQRTQLRHLNKAIQHWQTVASLAAARNMILSQRPLVRSPGFLYKFFLIALGVGLDRLF